MKYDVITEYRYSNAHNSLKLLVAHEMVLLNAVRDNEVSRSPPVDRGAVADMFVEEMKGILAWEGYLLNNIRMPSSGLPPILLEAPECPCLPRTRAKRQAWLQSEFVTENDDPLLRLVVQFCGDAIFAHMIGQEPGKVSSWRLRQEIAKRLIALGSGGVDSTERETKGAQQKLKPSPKGTPRPWGE